jgi:protein phosphatase
MPPFFHKHDSPVPPGKVDGGFAPLTAQDADRTDPLACLGQSQEHAITLLSLGGNVLEQVTLASNEGAAAPFLRLSISAESLAPHVQGALLHLPETATGFRDLLVREGVALCVALDAPEATLADWLGGAQPGIYLRPLLLLRGFADLAQLLNYLADKAGQIWPAPDAQWIGLASRQATGQAPGYPRQTMQFLAWPQLAAGDVTAAAQALARLLLQGWRRCTGLCEQSGFITALDSMRAWDSRLAELADDPGLDFAALAAALEPSPPRLSLHGATDVGRRREHNEDAYLLYQLDQHSVSGARLCLAAVADGMGGHASGEVASSLALDLLRQQLAQMLIPPRASLCDPQQLPAALKSLIPAIDSALVERARLEPALAGMGTTLCGLALLSAQSTVSVRESPLPWRSVLYWAGDSRAYLFGPCGLVPLSTDHSYVEELLAAGEIAPEDAFSHPLKNVITRCLGGNGGSAVPDVLDFTLGPGELVLLCSDGLSDALRDAQLWDVACAARATGCAQLARALIDAANAAGGPDNITVVLVEYTIS